jgi:hypothetical protein
MTNEIVTTDQDGTAELCGFLGDYQIVATLPDGTTIRKSIRLKQPGTTVNLAPEDLAL